MYWKCPKCKRKSLLITDGTYKESSKYYCENCNKYFSFDEFLDANKDRMAKVNEK